MNSNEAEEWLKKKDVRPTANRILVLEAFAGKRMPMSLADLDEKLVYMDKSSIFRTLSLFVEHDVLHSFEDGRGVTNYELCHDENECHHRDWHIHFYCEKCQHSFCLDDVEEVNLPKGFEAHTISFVVKGICAGCLNKKR